ncbi:SDR family oxidoreductase [Halobacteriovorax sp. RT-2-6]|uniref:SDR family oxidoreductase n=1 Tax=unclassified Halobacteriovorax TaxID=2639665 RepID=UPI00399A9FBA
MKSVIVTGDSRGVGLEIVKTILENSEYRVVGISRKINDITKALSDKYNGRFVHIDFDMSNVDGIKDLYKKKLKEFSPIVGFVNNAALAYDDIITNLNSVKLEDMYKVNVFAPFMLTKYVLRDMLLHKQVGSIVHISSISAHTGYKGLAMYASSKGALEAFSKNTAREWGAIGVRSNVVCPGFMETEMSSTLSEDQKNRIYKRNSMKKPTKISCVASTVNFLLSSGSSSITGEVIHVDSGTI